MDYGFGAQGFQIRIYCVGFGILCGSLELYLEACGDDHVDGGNLASPKAPRA